MLIEGELRTKIQALVASTISKGEMETRLPRFRLTFLKKHGRFQVRMVVKSHTRYTQIYVRKLFREALENRAITKGQYDEYMDYLVSEERKLYETVNYPEKATLGNKHGPRAYFSREFADLLSGFSADLMPNRALHTGQKRGHYNHALMRCPVGRDYITINLLYRWAENHGYEFDHELRDVRSTIHQNANQFHFRLIGKADWKPCYFVVGSDKELYYDVI